MVSKKQPIPDSAEVTPIITYPCHVWVDHYKVIFVSGAFCPGMLVQDNSWEGPLFVLRYVTEGGLEMVAECVSRDITGSRIVWYLVVSNLRVHHHRELRALTRFEWYPEALDSHRYVRKAFADDTLPIAGPIIAYYSDCPSLPPTYSSFPSSSEEHGASNSLSSFANAVFHYLNF